MSRLAHFFLSLVSSLRRKFSILVPGNFVQHNKLADVPTSEDKFGYDEFARAITKKISAAMLMGATPLTIGVHGAWGTGKSSFLKLTQKELEKEGITPIWFNAWKYNQEENLWSALLQKILDDAPLNYPFFVRPFIKIRLNLNYVNFGAGALEVTTKTIIFVLRLVLVVLGAGIALGFLEKQLTVFLTNVSSSLGPNNAFVTNFFQPKVARWISALIAFIATNPKTVYDLFSGSLGIDISKFQKKRAYKDHISFLDNFDKDFRKIIKTISGKKPLVVFIDDLDRCLPEKTIQILEAIKLFLDVQNCIFLIAVDREVIERAVYIRYTDQSKIGSEKSTEAQLGNLDIYYLAQNYLEKIIQLPFNIPPLPSERIKSYVSFLYPEGDDNNCNKIFSENLPPNPRKIKRVLQTFMLLSQIAEERKQKNLSLPLLAKLVIIENRFRTLHQDIIVFPELLDGIERILRQNEADLPVSIVPISDALIYQSKLDIHIKNTEIIRLLKSGVVNGSFLGIDVTDYVFLLKTVRETTTHQQTPKSVQDQAEIASDVNLTTEMVASSDENLEIQASITKSYLNNLINLNQYLSLQGITPYTKSFNAQLDDIYVPIMAEEVLTNLPEPSHEIIAQNIYTLPQLLNRFKRFTLLGDPGSGKSALLSYLTIILAKSLLVDPGLLKEKLGLDEFSILPIPVKVRDFASFLVDASEADSRDGVDVFLKFLYRHFNKQQISLPENFFENRLENGKAFVFVDGLDEADSSIVRNRISRVIENVANRYPNNRYILTSRVVGYFGAATVAANFSVLKLRALDKSQKKAFIQNLEYVIELSRAKAGASHEVSQVAEEVSTDLFQLIENKPHLSGLSDNPLLLALIVFIHNVDRKLPSRKSDLYDMALKLMLGNWDEMRGLDIGIVINGFRLDQYMLRNVFEKIALMMHREEKREIYLPDVRRILQAEFRKLSIDDVDRSIEDFLLATKERIGLFVEQIPGIFSFLPFVFQEYLAALALSKLEDYLNETLSLLHNTWWREVIILEAGILSTQGRTRINELVISVLNAEKITEPEPNYDLKLAVDSVKEAGLECIDGQLIEKINALLSSTDLNINLN